MLKISIQQICLTKSILLIFLFYSNVIFTQNNYFITSHGEWFIASPFIGCNSAQDEQKENYIQFLQDLGEKADELWQRTNEKSQLLINLNEMFKSVDKYFLNNLIEQILQNQELLESITQKSYRNVTGFFKIVLAEGGKKSWKIRLHVWQEQEEKEFPHNHKWDFYSKVISGYLLQETYEKVDDSYGFELLSPLKRYSIAEPVSLMPILPNGQMHCPCRDDYILEAKKISNNNVLLGIKSKEIIALGESYTMPFHLIHAINPGRNAISLVFTSRNTTDNSEVFVPMDMLETDLRRHASSFTKDTLIQELRRAKKLLNQLHIHERYLPEVVDQNHHYKIDTLEDLNWRRDIIENPGQKRVIQLSKQSMQKFLVSAFHDGTLLVGGNIIDSTDDYLFVLYDGKMYASPKDFFQNSDELICHSSFTDYGSVESAGLLSFDDKGTLIKIEAYSGHYTPSLSNMEIAKKYLRSIGVNTQQAVLSTYQDRS